MMWIDFIKKKYVFIVSNYCATIRFRFDSNKNSFIDENILSNIINIKNA